jgi:predicted O-methyltransferase YrrM
MNCIFITVFNEPKYIELLYLLLESIYIWGNINEKTNILIYTSTEFMNIIKKSELYNDKIIKFEINNTYNNIEKACKARIDIFKLNLIANYNKILYLDTDILIKDDINKVFDLCKDNILYTLEEGNIFNDLDYWGKSLFVNEINNYINKDLSAFTSGILLFKNCHEIRYLFDKINEDVINRPYNFECQDQPYIVYNAFKYNLYNNKILKLVAVNNDSNIFSDKVIHHFPGGVGIYAHKIEAMSIFLNSKKDNEINNNIEKTKKIINNYLLPIIYNSGELLEGNIFMIHNTYTYTDLYLNKVKNISNLLFNKNIKNVLEIGFNSGFSALLMLISNPNIHLTCYDIGLHKYTLPCYLKLKELFPDRINIVIGDSTIMLKENNNIYDLIHIDGSHKTEDAESDIRNSFRLSKHGTILIMDDYDFHNIHELWDNYINKYNLKSLNINIYETIHHDIKYVCLNV